jgi:predicted TIM-barrel fold metal-dependent hydrolase
MNRRDFVTSCTAGLAVSALANNASAADRPSIVIDAHAHVGSMLGMGFRDVSFEDFLAAADEAGIHKICLSSITALEFDAESGNKVTREAALRYPNRILPLASIPDAHLGKRGLEMLERTVTDWGFRGYGELETNASDPIDHPYWIAVLESAARHRIPVLVHGPAGPAVAAARRVPEATLILAHGGTGWGVHYNEWIDAVLAVRNFKNIYFETCTSILSAGFIEFAVTELGADRVIFGTDSPLLDPAVMMAKITGAEISDEAKRKILGDNMRTILRL